MNSAEIKLKLFRFLDQQDEDMLLELYRYLVSKSFSSNKKISSQDFLEMSYLTMSMDLERERDAQDWIENSTDYSDL